MKKNKIYIVLGIALAALTINNFTLEIDNKGHYFVNGIICGVGLSVVVVQLLRLRKMKGGNKSMKFYQQ